MDITLKELLEEWYKGINFMEEAAIRDPPSKHQAQVRYLQNKIHWLMDRVLKDEGKREK
ncbi:unnamed protein product [marine sediment metagenome]|uniref:Uncharacterized protein n=1 Tax=marine sediment metagenome TaxID=412755 RepID=X0X2M5_9ZZZZ